MGEINRDEFLKRISGKVNTLISLNEGDEKLTSFDDDLGGDNQMQSTNIDSEPKKRVKSVVEDEIEFRNQINDDDDALNEALEKSNLPDVVKEAYKKHRQPKLDAEFINETMGGTLTTQQIKERYGKLMLDESSKKLTKDNFQKLVDDKKETYNHDVYLDDIRTIIKEELENNEKRNVVLRVGDTLTFSIGGNIYDCGEIKVRKK
jgi:hypothetical protein